jgi:bidirectional [NiFe] hydrogenase diaphorase subunit
MTKTCSIIIDGRPAAVAPGAMLLAALREQGVAVPTLCHHPSLDPSGACRLCVVEITHPDWGGWSGLVTSCLYPVEPGLQVATRSPRVTAARRTLLELYLAQCPDSVAVRAVARSEGVDATPFAIKPDANLCIHCGLCTRVCEELGPGAIAALGRGTDKVVGPRPDMFGEDCTGCLACEYVCPTGEISSDHRDGRIAIWNRTFAVPLAAVEQDLCRGCGACEEVCPLSIPRVSALRSGALVASISPDRCVGCGLCAGICPTGAILQPDSAVMPPATRNRTDRESPPGTAERAARSEPAAVVFACSRSPLDRESDDVISVPCIGRVPLEAILARLAGGTDGVLLMCRDQATCPYGRGGCQGRERAEVAAELAALAGLGRDRVRYVRPEPGRTGPHEALARFRKALSLSPLSDHFDVAGSGACGLDGALGILSWLKSRPELAPALPAAWTALFDDPEPDTSRFLFLGDLPEIDLLLRRLVPHWRLRDLVADAVEWLRSKGIAVRPVLRAGDLQAVTARTPAPQVYAFSRRMLPPLDRRVEIVTLDELAAASRSKDDAPKKMSSKMNNNMKFQITLEERREILDGLAIGAPVAVCETPYLMAQIKLLTRIGAWLEAPSPEPMMAFQHAMRTSGREIDA